MNKRVGNIEINSVEGSAWLTVTYHHNADVMDSIQLKSVEDMRDLQYAVGEALNEFNRWVTLHCR